MVAVAGSVMAVPVSVIWAATGPPAVSPAAARAALVRTLRDSSAPAVLVRRGATASGNAGSTTLDTYNWSGYADTATKKGSFTSVGASWTVPSVTCTTEDQISSQWVGFDGLFDRTVEQEGTLGQCFEGSPFYYDWYEMYPSGTVVEQSVVPGDQVTAALSRTGTSYSFSLVDATHGADSFTTSATCKASKCKDTSAEWVAERPDYLTTGIVPLVDFGSWSVSGASVTSGSTLGTINSFAPTALDMQDSTASYALDSTNPASGATTGFTTTWADSY